MKTDRGIHVSPGMRIAVTQRIENREGARDTEIVGTLLSADPKPTGSWFAHGRDGKSWLVRIELQKADGEISRLVLDRNTRISVIEG